MKQNREMTIRHKADNFSLPHRVYSSLVLLGKKQVGDIFQFDKKFYMACRAGFEPLNMTVENDISVHEMILKSA